MNIREYLPVLAGLGGLVAVVVVSSFVLGGYGLILSGVVGACWVCSDPEPRQDK